MNLKQILSIIPVILGAGCTTLPTGEIHTEAYNQYNFRGLNFGEDPVIQTTAKVNLDNTNLNGFHNYDTGLHKETETDFWIETGKDTPIGFSFIGWGHFHFPNLEFPDTEEAYAGLVIPFKLTPTLFVAHDYKLGNGTYVEGSIEHTADLPHNATLNLKLFGAYNNHYYLTDSDMSHIKGAATISLPATKNCTLELKTEHVEALRDDIESTNTYSAGIRFKW